MVQLVRSVTQEEGRGGAQASMGVDGGGSIGGGLDGEGSWGAPWEGSGEGSWRLHGRYLVTSVAMTDSRITAASSGRRSQRAAAAIRRRPWPVPHAIIKRLHEDAPHRRKKGGGGRQK